MGERLSQPVIDLNLKFIDDDVAIWRVYPGTKKDFVRQFIKEDCVFLELPGMDLTPKDLVEKWRVTPKIARAKALADWYLTEPDDRPSQPSDDLKDYAAEANSRSVSMAYWNFVRLFVTAKVGDLVIIPEDDGFQSKLYIGEITEDFDPKNKINVKQFAHHSVPFRRVKWLRKDFERRLISVDLSRELGGRRAVKALSTEDFGHYIFRLAYQNFVYAGEAQYVFEGEKYDNDPEATVPGIQLLSYALAAANAVVAGDKDLVAQLDIDDVRDSDYRRQNVIAFEIAFASPGGYRVWHGSVRALLLALSLVAVTGCDMSVAEVRTASVENSQNATPQDCLQKLQDDYGDLMGSIKPQVFEKLKKDRKKANNGVGFDTKVCVKN